MSVITNLMPTTELEAVNAMLSAIGEAPVSSLAGTQPDLVMAINTLRNTARAVQSVGWTFNTEFGYQVAPFALLLWEDTDSIITELNIFKPDPNLARFSITSTSPQSILDVVLRPSRAYTEGGSPVIVFYDRSLNRDGLDSTLFPYLYIDPVWLFDYEHLPEQARRLIYVQAARQFIQEQVGSDTLARFKGFDEAVALRNLKESHGLEDTYNMLTNNSVYRILGGRGI